MNRWKIATITVVVGLVIFGLLGGYLHGEHRYTTGYKEGIADLGDAVEGAFDTGCDAKYQEVREILGMTVEEAKTKLDYLASLPEPLHDPTYEEAVAFLKEDGTDKETPSDYALAAIITAENAAKQGIRCYWVVAQLQAGYGYNFIGFNTTDKGWIYFAATVDFEVKLVENEDYFIINDFQNPGIEDTTIVSLHYLPTP
jgi:hypothetical protein